MKSKMSLNNLGIELSASFHNSDDHLLQPASDADQKNPRKNYVYAHMDTAGKIFNVGKGVGRRAWSTDRHPLWHRYVEKHLNGVFQVRILRDNLSDQQAEEIETAWIAQCSTDLVNWMNMGRATNFPALERFHKLRDANRALILQAKIIENNSREQAAKMYIQAIESIREYAFIDYEEGFVGQLLREEDEEFGKQGDIAAINRLTMCLMKLNRPAEAIQHANDYFALYRRDMQLGAYQGIAKRIEKARSLIEKDEQASSIGGALKVTKNPPMGGSNKLAPDVSPPQKRPELPTELPFRKDLKVPSDTVDRNLLGIKMEAEGLIDNAIQCYEANVRDGFEGNGPYDRLAIIYGRRGDIEKEVAVLRRAIEVFERLQTSPRLDVVPKLTKFRERLWRASERLKRSK